MREIKFRAWDKETKTMSVPRRLEDLCIMKDTIADFAIMDGSLEFMQYTGIKDKNGVEIYEGDIVRTRQHATYPNEVYWDERTVGFRMRFNGEMQFDKTMAVDFAKFGEVIGNIHENPVTDGLPERDWSESDTL